jgi:hypothetical protein
MEQTYTAQFLQKQIAGRAFLIQRFMLSGQAI